MALDLQHVLYTNAPQRDERSGGVVAGFRTLFPDGDLPLEGRERLGRWLAGLRPTGDRMATAWASFRLGRRLYAVLARIDPLFTEDEHGRGGGVLAHALLAGLDEGRPPGDLGSALWEAWMVIRGAADPRGQAADRRLEVYRQACAAHSQLPPEPIDPATVAGLGEETVVSFLGLAGETANSTGRIAAVPPAGDPDFAATLLRVASVLPVRLRLAHRFGVALHPATDVGTVVTSGSESSPAIGGEAAVAVYRWLVSEVASGNGKRVVAVADDWGIRSWDQLRLAIAAPPQ